MCRLCQVLRPTTPSPPPPSRPEHSHTARPAPVARTVVVPRLRGVHGARLAAHRLSQCQNLPLVRWYLGEAAGGRLLLSRGRGAGRQGELMPVTQGAGASKALSTP